MNPAHLKITVQDRGPKGGQTCGATPTGVVVEHLPTGLVLRFALEAGNAEPAELFINLDMFEMLERLNEGYRPSVEEMQGYYLSLAVFKNALNAAPYREIMLTTSGHDFYRLERQADGKLQMARLREVA